MTQYQAGMPKDERPQEITAGPDGALWFTARSKDGPALGRIAVDGTISLSTNGITFGARPIGIHAGVGNTIWFTEQALNRVARASF